MRIVFMGTPDFAVPSLEILHQSGRHTVVGVVTAPDKPAGRGLQLTPSAVKQYAVSQGIPVLQPEKLRNESFLAALQALEADCFVVVAFRMLPELVWAMPPKGTFNLHASLLPDYRGAAPINWAVMNGEPLTGATTFLLDKQIDTGNILFRYTCDLPDHWTAGDLHDHLMVAGANLVLQTADALEAGEVQPQPQDESSARHHAPKLFRETCEINWNQPTEAVRNHVRGLAPFPGAWTTFQSKPLKIYEIAHAESGLPATEPGTWNFSEGKLLCATADGWAEAIQIQPEGKRRMAAADFVRGLRIG